MAWNGRWSRGWSSEWDDPAINEVAVAGATAATSSQVAQLALELALTASSPAISGSIATLTVEIALVGTAAATSGSVADLVVTPGAVVVVPVTPISPPGHVFVHMGGGGGGSRAEIIAGAEREYGALLVRAGKSRRRPMNDRWAARRVACARRSCARSKCNPIKPVLKPNGQSAIQGLASALTGRNSSALARRFGGRALIQVAAGVGGFGITKIAAHGIYRATCISPVIGSIATFFALRAVSGSAKDDVREAIIIGSGVAALDEISKGIMRMIEESPVR